MTNSQIDALRAVVGSDLVLAGAELSEDYSHDELGSCRRMPDAVVRVRTAEEVSAVLRFSDEHNIPVTPRGAGTGLVGACVPLAGGILLETTRMNRILELDRENLTLTVEPGVLLMDVYAYVEPLGLFYPPDPGEKSATIGGNIATNAGGMRAVKYGVTRDFVRGLEVVLPSGERIELGGKVVKNSSGYALKDLMVGSEGTLGVITKAILRLLPLPARTLSLLVPFPTLHQAIDAAPALVKSGLAPTAVEFMQREVIADAEEYLGSSFPDKQSDAYLLLKFDGDTAAQLERTCEQAAELCLSLGASDVLIADTDERSDSLWTPRGAFLEAIKGSTTRMDEVDAVVPPAQVNAFVSYIPTVSEAAGLRIKCFGHAGDGNLHIYLLQDALDDAAWEHALTHAMELLYQKAHLLGGQISGEHGIGHAKKPYLSADLAPAVLALMRGVKQVFDPKGLLNPGKIL